MIEIKDVTVYKCEHCEFTGTFKNVVQKHEEKCLINQDKTSKNIDKAEIYNILDIDLINIKIGEFVKKHNLPLSSELEFVQINIGNSYLPSIIIDNSVRGIFDWTKFRLHNILSEQRYSKEYLNLVSDEIQSIDKNIVLKETELGILLDTRKETVLKSVKEYLKGIK